MLDIRTLNHEFNIFNCFISFKIVITQFVVVINKKKILRESVLLTGRMTYLILLNSH